MIVSYSKNRLGFMFKANLNKNIIRSIYLMFSVFQISHNQLKTFQEKNLKTTPKFFIRKGFYAL